MKFLVRLALIIALLASLFLSVAPAAPPLAMEEFMVPADAPGIKLYVRNKHPRDATKFPADKILLYVHGATYPASTAFDLQLNGLSWMDFLAAHGYDVYLVDLTGYGKSTRPPEMDQPAEANEPIVRTATAVRDVGAAVDFILKRRGADKLNLLGWSWGTSTMGWPARVTLSDPTTWPLANGATKGSARATWVLILAALPAGTATTIASARPIFKTALLPFQTFGVTTGWFASNSLTASNAV